MVAWEINHDQEKVLEHFLIGDNSCNISSKLDFSLVVFRTFEFLKLAVEFVKPNLLRVGGLLWNLLKDGVVKDVPILLTVDALVESCEHSQNYVLALNDPLIIIHFLKTLNLEHCQLDNP